MELNVDLVSLVSVFFSALAGVGWAVESELSVISVTVTTNELFLLSKGTTPI